MGELTHEQLWKVCQRKPGDYEPYGKHDRLTATRPALILLPWTGAFAAIPGAIEPGSSRSSIRAVPNLSRSNSLFSQSYRSKNSQGLNSE
jgi:hypothetical protein